LVVSGGTDGSNPASGIKAGPPPLIATDILILRQKFRSWWDPDRRRWGPQLRVAFRRNFKKLMRILPGSRFGADSHCRPSLSLGVGFALGAAFFALPVIVCHIRPHLPLIPAQAVGWLPV
jgi:hypothetical protein